ncbi:MAG: MFS transporter [Pirellulales bacterium]|nr:MFS transporter [Pirellulales bacterium]
MTSSPGRGSLAVLFLAVFIDLLGFGIVIPLLPIYADQFLNEYKALLVGLLFASFSAMQFLFAPVWGRISDTIGRRPVLMIGLGGSVVFYALFGWATMQRSVILLFVSRIGAGIAGATIGTAQAYIADTTPHQERSRGMALIGAAFGLGFTLGPLFAILALVGESATTNVDGTVSITPSGMPGFAAAGLSLAALLLAYFKLPESYQPGVRPARRSWIDREAMRTAVSVPSVGLLILASFVTVFAFANFESTLALLLRRDDGGRELAVKPFDYDLAEICLTFAYIGFVLLVVQGGFVRRFAKKYAERSLASFGVLVSVIGNAVLIYAAYRHLQSVLFVGLGLVVSGFAFITPSINSLISRRTPPEKQGLMLGLLQSANSMARIFGPLAGVPLIYRSGYGPFALAILTMLLGGGMIVIAAKRGGDYRQEDPSPLQEKTPQGE